MLAGTAIVAAGRYEFYGQIISVDYHYAFDLAVPLALALALAWRPGRRKPVRPHAEHQARYRVLLPAVAGG